MEYDLEFYEDLFPDDSCATPADIKLGDTININVHSGHRGAPIRRISTVVTAYQLFPVRSN